MKRRALTGIKEKHRKTFDRIELHSHCVAPPFSASKKPDKEWHLAVPVTVHQAFFQPGFTQLSVERYQIKRLIYNPIQEMIVQWI